VTADLTRMALWLCPLACLALVPLQLLRPAFEGLQRGWPGLIMAILRYVILAPPAAFLGKELAIQIGTPAIHGIVVGLICASTLSSLVFFVWLQRVLVRLEVRSSSARDPAPAP
jgi:Na+-driven multidrug efflux pump